MKILVLTSYMYDSENPRFSRRKTGLGIMVRDISGVIGATEEVYFLSNIITPKDRIGNIEILPHRWRHILSSLKMKDILESFSILLKGRRSLSDKLHEVYYCLDSGYVRKVLGRLKPDIVHIHDTGLRQKIYIRLCDELHIPYLLTIHLLLGKHGGLGYSNDLLEIEQGIIERKEKINISVISSGMMKRITSEYNFKFPECLYLIVNGTSIKGYEPRINIYQKYKLKQNKKIMICSGNLSIRKNQEQVLRAFLLLPKEVREACVLLFMGADGLGGKLAEQIKAANADEIVKYCGFVPYSDMGSFYNEAVCVVTATRDEGFGLSIIEGFMYGVPVIAFDDIDAIPDVYDKGAMVLVHERSDRALMEGMKSALKTKWDRDYIRRYAKKFEMENVADKYVETYRKILGN